ncbi:unnamed protein product [Closterium sp. NIES-53]
MKRNKAATGTQGPREVRRHVEFAATSGNNDIMALMPLKPQRSPWTADSATRSQWLTRVAAARLAIRNHLPLVECAHFGQHRTAQALDDAVVARYSSPATAALGRLLLPYLFPELSAFATVEDLVSHLGTSDARYRAALPAEFLAKNPPPMYITLYFIVTRLPDSLHAVRDHFLALDPTDSSGVAIFDLDYDAILAAMYALSASSEGDCYLCVPPDLGVEATALGASESVLPGTAPAEALHTFTLDSGASRCFFRDSNTLTPLSSPVPVRLADPSGGPVLARSSTVLPCLAVPSGSLSSLHLLSFFTNLVSTAALQDAMVTTTTPGGQLVSIWMCTRTGRHLATFTRRPGSSLCTLATEPPQVPASAKVSASGPVAPPCSCCLLSHQTLLWHHRLGHPSLPRLRGNHSRLLVSGLPRSLPPLPPLPAPPCLPCVEGRQCAAPHSSSFPLTIAPLQTLHIDVWGPAHVIDVLIPWIRAVRLQLRERFRTNLPVLRLHSDRGGELSFNLLWEFCRGEGILQSFTLPDCPHQNGIAERRIGLVMEVARTSMIHAAAAHFCGCLRSDKLFTHAIPCVFLGFSPDAPG